MRVGRNWRNSMSDNDKFRNFAKYQLDYEQSERQAFRRRWALILIVAGSSIALAWFLYS